MKKLTELTSPITPQKVANAMSVWVAKDSGGQWYVYETRPSTRGIACWMNDGGVHRINCLDIQWKGDWHDSLHEPEPEILSLNGAMPEVLENRYAWIAQMVGEGNELVGVYYFKTRAQAIRAWNAVVRSLNDD